jgi:hypothetical protein
MRRKIIASIKNTASQIYLSTKLAFEMTLSEWKDYKKEHPMADKRNHHIVQDTKQQVQVPQVKSPTTVHPNKIKMTKQELTDTLTKGHYSVISAGKNPKLEADMTPEQAAKRHEELQSDLDSLGLPYTEVVGHYGGEERSFLVVHENHEHKDKSKNAFMVKYKPEQKDKAREEINKLGKKYNQDSVLHGAEGRNDIQFTTGKHEGKNCGGKGWQETPEAQDFYTDAEVKGKEHTKFNVDIGECFEKGFFD